MIEALLVVGLSFFNPQVPTDSLGTEMVNGKVVVVHRVEEKETLYSLSRRYGTGVDDILLLNPDAKDGLEVGDVLKIPFNRKSNTVSTSTTSGGVHVVKEKETLYSISRTYEVSIDDIKEWNHLTSNSLSLGQELVIKKTSTQPTTPPSTSTPVMTIQKGVHEVAPKETMFSISKQYSVSIDEIRRWNNLESNDLKVGQLIFVAPPKNQGEIVTSPSPAVVVSTPVVKEEPAASSPATSQHSTNEPVASRTITVSENAKDSNEIIQAGLAELIEGTEGNRKYLALHRSAPVGTILKVRNEMNNREVFVRVIGQLPDTALTSKLIIKVSRSAYDRLGAIDPRFRVEVTYYK